MHRTLTRDATAARAARTKPTCGKPNDRAIFLGVAEEPGERRVRRRVACLLRGVPLARVEEEDGDARAAVRGFLRARARLPAEGERRLLVEKRLERRRLQEQTDRSGDKGT